MGYTTDFDGVFTLNKPLDEETQTYLENFARTRRMKRDPKVLEQLGFGPAESFGVDGEFFVNEDDVENYGQKRDESILEYNTPPATQPGLWCQWIPTDDGLGIEWDGGEKFYDATEWITYLIDNILAPKGYVLNGVVDASGEDFGDNWYIEIIDNVVKEGQGHYGTVDQWNQLETYLENLAQTHADADNPEVLRVIKQVQAKTKELR